MPYSWLLWEYQRPITPSCCSALFPLGFRNTTSSCLLFRRGFPSPLTVGGPRGSMFVSAPRLHHPWVISFLLTVFKPGGLAWVPLTSALSSRPPPRRRETPQPWGDVKHVLHIPDSLLLSLPGQIPNRMVQHAYVPIGIPPHQSQGGCLLIPHPAYTFKFPFYEFSFWLGTICRWPQNWKGAKGLTVRIVTRSQPSLFSSSETWTLNLSLPPSGK